MNCKKTTYKVLSQLTLFDDTSGEDEAIGSRLPIEMLEELLIL